MQEFKEQLLFLLTEFLALQCLLLQRLLQLILLLGQLAERGKTTNKKGAKLMEEKFFSMLIQECPITLKKKKVLVSMKIKKNV